MLASGLIIAINPQDKIRAANDAKVQNDISQIVGAAIALSAANEGGFPATLAELAPSELTVVPSAPTGYNNYTLVPAPAACTTAAKNCTSVVITGQLRSNKYTLPAPGYPLWRYDSVTAKTCASLAATPFTCKP